MYKSNRYSFKIIVVKQLLKNSLLGRSYATKHGLVKIKCADVHINDKILAKTRQVVTLKDDAKAYNVMTPRRVSFPIQTSVRLELKKMENAGIIEKTSVPTD